MPVDADDIVSGAYSGVWKTLAIGNIGLGGYKLRYAYSRKDVNFDAVGNVPVDILFTGLNMFVDFVLMQYNKPAVSAMTWPWSIIKGTVPAAGKALWDTAGPLVLSACSSEINPRTITFHKTIVAPDYEQIHNYESTVERMIPMRLIVLPVKYNSAGYSTPERPAGCEEVTYYTETLVP